MIRKRLTRALASSGLALALVMTLLAIPMTTIAATPNWSGTLSTLPPTITAGDVAGYRATITNGGPSNISQLTVTVTFSQPYVATTAAGTGPAPVYVTVLKDGVTLTNPCGTDPTDPPLPASGPLACDVGALNANSTAKIIVAYQTDASTNSAGVTVRWTSIGLGSGTGDNSRGDVLTQTFDTANPPTAMGTSSTNFDGGFTTALQTEFATSAVLNATNLFGTTFKAGQYIPVTIEDDADSDLCPTGKVCYGTDTQNAIVLHINEGQAFTAPFKVVIQIFKDAVAKGSSASKLTVVHYFDTPKQPGNIAYESISNDCPKTGTPTSVCRTVTWDGKTGIYTVTVWLFENGVVKFH